MAEDSDLEKTEEPTPHKREKSEKDGQIVPFQRAFVRINDF